MNQNNEKIKFGEKLRITQLNFIDALKDLHPIAFLGSFSLLIASFSQNKFISAQDYAITASICFLTAFLTSAIFKIDKNPYTSLLSILFIISGFIFLFLVAWEYAKIANLAHKVIGIIIILPTAILSSIIYRNLIKENYNEFKTSTLLSYRFYNFIITLSLILGLVLIIVYIIFRIYNSFFMVEETTNNFMVVGLGIFGYVVLIKDIFIKNFFKYDEEQNKFTKFRLINNIFYYNSAFGIIFFNLGLYINIFLKNQIIQNILLYTSLSMIFILNIILILIKKHIKSNP